MTRSIVFIAGPLRHANPAQVEAHIMTAKQAAVDLAALGLSPYCPHANLAHGLGLIRERDAKAVNDSFLKLADAVLRLPGWGHSVGARLEIDLAAQLGTPIFDSIQEVREWRGRRR